jgi:uncharacterized protein (DUF1778 family)
VEIGKEVLDSENQALYLTAGEAVAFFQMLENPPHLNPALERAIQHGDNLVELERSAREGHL